MRQSVNSQQYTQKQGRNQPSAATSSFPTFAAATQQFPIFAAAKKLLPCPVKQGWTTKNTLRKRAKISITKPHRGCEINWLTQQNIAYACHQIVISKINAVRPNLNYSNPGPLSDIRYLQYSTTIIKKQYLFPTFFTFSNLPLLQQGINTLKSLTSMLPVMIFSPNFHTTGKRPNWQIPKSFHETKTHYLATGN